MTVNAGPEYFSAEKKYLASKTNEDRIKWLEEMIRASPKHKSSEHFVANLKQRLAKIVDKAEKASKTGKGKKGIKKEGFQIVLLGFTNSGKSSLLSKLTNAHPYIAESMYTTKEPIIGTFNYQGAKAQVVDLPSIGAEFFDIGIINTADLILIVVNNIDEIEKIKPYLNRAYGKTLIAINKADLLNEEELRKLNEKIKSKKINAIVTSSLSEYGVDDLKNALIKSMNIIRVYTKEPGKKHSPIPVVLKQGSTVKDVAEQIRKGFSLTIKETRLTGPSSKFSNQRVGLSHVLKDLDIVEFHTK